MTAPRLEIDLAKIRHNAATLVGRLKARGITVTGVTKATLGDPRIAGALLQAGVPTLADSRIENIEAMRQAGIEAPMILIRSPMISQADRIVAHANVSLNTELDVIGALADAARRARRTHDIILMVELGDLREGIMPEDLEHTVRETLRLPTIRLRGIGANLACRSGVSPDAGNMAELSAMANAIEAAFNLQSGLRIISGGSSANLPWALGGADTGRINNLRLGESILLGLEPLHRRPIDGLHQGAITLVAEVIEAKTKPSLPWGDRAQTAFGEKPLAEDRGNISHTIVAIGHQDTDPDGLCPPPGIDIIGASSDHLVLDSGTCPLKVGTEISFRLSYGALIRAMTSPFVAKIVKNENGGSSKSHRP
jgi:predicted amino acid racemase